MSALVSSRTQPPDEEQPDVSTTPLKVAVTGAAGQIGYSLLFRLARPHSRYRTES